MLTNEIEFLQGDEMVGRADLQFDRQCGALVVRGLWWMNSVGNTTKRKRQLTDVLDGLAQQIGADTCELR